MHPTIQHQPASARIRRSIAVLATLAAAALTGQQAASAATLHDVHFAAPAVHFAAAPDVHFFTQTSGAAAVHFYNCNW